MGKDGDHSDGAKVYESKKEKKRRLVMNNESESEELVLTPRVEIFQAGNGAAGGRRSLVLEKGGDRQKGLEREDVLKRKLGSEGSNKGKVLESRSNRSKEVAVDQSDDEDIKLDSADSAGNQTDTTGAIAESLVSLQPSNKLTAGAKEKAFESKFYRKRSIERVDDGDEFSRKRIKTENTDSIDNQSENSRESNKITGGSKGCVQVSNLSVPIAQHRDEDCSSEGKLQQSGSGQRELRKVRDARSSDVGIKMEVGDGGSSQHSYGRPQAKSGVLRVLKSRNKASGSQNANSEFKLQGNAMRLRSSTTNKFSGSNRQLQREADKKSISNAKQQKGAGKVSSEDASKSNVSKANLKNISQKKGSKNHANEQNGSRSAAKNKVRDQIKTILFDAGWKIEFRPRRGRNYEDAVYVSPQGSGYWSITKAYAVYVRQFKRAEDDKENSGNESKSSAPKNNDSKEANSTLAVIPPEVLHMLKRNVVNKRRRKKEIEDAKLKVGGGKRKKKPKEISKAKYSKDKGSRNDVGGAGAIKRKVTVRNSKRRGCALLVRGSNQDEGSEQGDYTPYAWKRTVLSWMIDLGVVPANGKVRYMNKRTSRGSLDGRITRDGIQCGCCGKILTVSKFEIHAGSKLHRPYENICLEASGISLLQCQIDAWAKQEESTRRIFYDVDTHGDDPNDDSCGICGDGGDLICCDSCPSTFHLACLGIEMLPTGDWHCANCSCKFCGAVHNSASEDEKASDALFTCSQCARKYHKDCVPEDDAVSTASNSSCNVFCGKSCRKVFRKLQKIIGVRNELEAGFYWSIVRRLEDPSKPLSRMAQTVENNSKIAVAYAVMDECFVPITDQRSGISLIHNVVYNCGSNFNRLDFSGFYTFILERGDEIVAAASVRIHDTRLAEMPFIGTRCIYRRQGMCRRLLQGIESALRSLCIRNLIIPAISELEDTWTTVFGFKPLGLSQHQELKSVNILVFPGTGLLQKSLLNNSTKKHANNELVAENKSETQIHPDEAMDPIIPVLDHSTSNLVPEESQLRKSSDNVTDSESNNRNLVSCNNHVEKCSTEAVLRSEEPEPVTVSLHGAYGIESSEFRPQNQSNSELPVAENEGEKKPEEKSHSNGIAHDPDPKKGEFIDSNGPKSNVNQDAIDVTTNLNTSGVCENGSEAAARTRGAASNESSSPEKSEPLDRLTADDSAADDLLSKLKESTPANSVCDVSIAEKDLGVVEPVHGFDLASINQASKMVK